MCFLQGQTAVTQVALASVETEVLEPRLLEAIGQAQGYGYGFFFRIDSAAHAGIISAPSEPGRQRF
jgi:hypothetical protein